MYKGHMKSQKKINEELYLHDCVELEDSFAFYFDAEEGGGSGVPYILVSKETGEIGYLSCPPLTNLEVLQAGKPIDKSLVES